MLFANQMDGGRNPAHVSALANLNPFSQRHPDRDTYAHTTQHTNLMELVHRDDTKELQCLYSVIF